MGKYMRKAKTAADVALMEVAQSSPLGVRTRARTLALQKSLPTGGSFLQLRSRRLEKPPIHHSKRHKQQQQQHQQSHHVLSTSPNSTRTRLEFVNGDSISGGNLGIENLEEGFQENKNGDSGGGGACEASCGENVLDFEARERSTRESTPCSLIRDPESIRTPGSTTRPSCSTAANRGVQNSMPSHIPTAHEMENFFSGPEEEQQKQFMDKYNFDPVKDKPLPGRFEWEKLNP